MTRPSGLPSALAASADMLTDARSRLDRLERPDLRSLLSAPGRIGDLGRRLHDQLDAAWRDRSAELTTASAELTRVAEVIEGALQAYAEIDDQSRHGIGKAYQGDS